MNGKKIYRYKGACACGNAELDIELPEELHTYTPRACDCDYCTARNISYLSTPQDTLKVRCKTALSIDTQGSEQAEFHNCNGCRSLIVVTCSISGIQRGAVNADLLKENETLNPSVPVSPKKLTTAEKLARWDSAWLKVIFEKSVS